MAGFRGMGLCTAGHLRPVIIFIEHYGRVRGAAFPSEHVGGSVCRAVGRVAAPAMVVLGHVATGVVHVRFLRFGAVIHYLWWIFLAESLQGRAGICDGNGLCGERLLTRPVGRRGRRGAELSSVR